MFVACVSSNLCLGFTFYGFLLHLIIVTVQITITRFQKLANLISYHSTLTDCCMFVYTTLHVTSQWVLIDNRTCDFVLKLFSCPHIGIRTCSALFWAWSHYHWLICLFSMQKFIQENGLVPGNSIRRQGSVLSLSAMSQGSATSFKVQVCVPVCPVWEAGRNESASGALVLFTGRGIVQEMFLLLHFLDSFLNWWCNMSSIALHSDKM